MASRFASLPAFAFLRKGAGWTTTNEPALTHQWGQTADGQWLWKQHGRTVTTQLITGPVRRRLAIRSDSTSKP